MKERPILFSAPMVKTILEGRKTQTRRVCETQPGPNGSLYKDHFGFWWRRWATEKDLQIACPFGKPGDRLWVKEIARCSSVGPGKHEFSIYYGDFDKGEHKTFNRGRAPYQPGRNTPSIHMPRWASRITLEITEVRVERLQEISEEDAKDEGATPMIHVDNGDEAGFSLTGPGLTYKHGFWQIWSTIHASDGPKGWNANPWVWVITFNRIEKGCGVR